MTCSRKLGPYDCCTVVEGDCLELMKQLPDGSVDAVITSPPYNLGVSTGGGFPVGHYSQDATGMTKRSGFGKWPGAALADGYSGYDDAMPWPKYEAWQRTVLTECWRLLAEDGAIFYNHKPRPQNCIVWLPTALNPGLPLRQIITWKRAGGINFSPTHYVPTYEWILVLAKPAFRLRSKGASGIGDVWEIPQEPCSDHPAPFPEELPRRILSTINARVVLDPFGGRGTTAGVAKSLGRHYLSFDTVPDYCRIARERIALVEAQPTLFEKKPEQMTLGGAE